jgi:hypothetical protein
MRRLSLLPLVLPLLAGCGGGYSTAPVSGRVTLNGQPLANAAVVFQPVASEGHDPGPGSGGFTDQEGRYTLKVTGTGRKGAVVGKHKVTITLVPDDDPSDDRPKRTRRLPARYSRHTKLECEVPPGGTDSANFDLTTP